MGKRRIFGAAWLAAGALVVVVASGACRTPTQMTLDISYRGGMCGKAVAILAGDDPGIVEGKVEAKFYAAQTSTCDGSGHVGTLVLTPSGASAHGAVVVIAGISSDPSTCTPKNGYAGCVVARRAFAFSDHASLAMPITIDFACENVPCSETSSCKNRQCVSSTVKCNGDVCDDFGVLDDGGAAVEPDAPTGNEAGGADSGGDGSGPIVEGGTDSGQDAEGGAGTCPVSGVCPPYSGLAGPGCTKDPPGMPSKCVWDGVAMSVTATCVLLTDPTAHLYTQLCTSMRDCAPGQHCCSMANMAVCSGTPCPGLGSELCVGDCDCPGTTCTLTPPGQTAAPFIKTCSTTATHSL